MLTALLIQHDQGFHAHLVTLQHSNDVTICSSPNNESAWRGTPRGARAGTAAPRPPAILKLRTQTVNHIAQETSIINNELESGEARARRCGAARELLVHTRLTPTERHHANASTERKEAQSEHNAV
ncbi:hypothetical protein EVAR_74782_1 [Eumeta japonica]|uniref:Uncharacterized protein n=1 Tax=Eumeta variegata TaxID=151549 RepID=A0A4C1SPG7_EUMVA|nr:hypothetical protein EVAR_74782_1 [Eumeta japonica]